MPRTPVCPEIPTETATADEAEEGLQGLDGTQALPLALHLLALDVTGLCSQVWLIVVSSARSGPMRLLPQLPRANAAFQGCSLAGDKFLVGVGVRLSATSNT